MAINNDQIISFAVLGDLDVADVIDEILKNNNLPETPQERTTKFSQDMESRLIIVRDAAVVLFKKKISEERLVELLAEHLGASQETAGNIIKEIKEKLIPYAKLVTDEPTEEVNKTSAQDIILEKIKGKSVSLTPQPSPKPPAEVKKPQTMSVEENAKLMEKKKEEPLQPEKPQDTYREPLA